MNYANLIQNITENIKTNGSQAITARVLQDVLVDMVGELGQSGALLGGVIDTSFVPDHTNDAQVVYIAEGPGTYTNFNGLVVGAGEVAFFYFNGNAWAKSSVDVLEVVNNLNSTATDKALSAAMGKQIGDKIGTLSSLHTIDKNSLVNAINEVHAGMAALNEEMGEPKTTTTYGSESYCGYYYSDSQNKIIASGDTANGILIPIVPGVKYTYTPTLAGYSGVSLWSSVPTIGSNEGLTRLVIGNTGSFIPSEGDKYALIFIRLASYTSVTVTESASNIHGDIANLDNGLGVALAEISTNVYDSDNYCGYYYSPTSDKVLAAVSTVNGIIIPLQKGVKYTFDALNAPVTIWSDIPYLNSKTNFMRNLGNNVTEFVAGDGEYYALFNIVFSQTTERTIISGSDSAIKINEIYNCLTEENNIW